MVYRLQQVLLSLADQYSQGLLKRDTVELKSSLIQ